MYPIICNRCKEKIGEKETLDGLERLCEGCQ